MIGTSKYEGLSPVIFTKMWRKSSKCNKKLPQRKLLNQTSENSKLKKHSYNAEVVFQKLSAKKCHICTVGKGAKEEVKTNDYFWTLLGVLGNLPAHGLFLCLVTLTKEEESRVLPCKASHMRRNSMVFTEKKLIANSNFNTFQEQKQSEVLVFSGYLS